jgi:hypothetical protein
MSEKWIVITVRSQQLRQAIDGITVTDFSQRQRRMKTNSRTSIRKEFDQRITGRAEPEIASDLCRLRSNFRINIRERKLRRLHLLWVGPNPRVHGRRDEGGEDCDLQ